MYTVLANPIHVVFDDLFCSCLAIPFFWSQLESVGLMWWCIA